MFCVLFVDLKTLLLYLNLSEITDDCIAVSETSSLEEINILCSKVEDDRLEKFERQD